MFDKEFFPTPKEVLDQMGIDCWGKLCLEPQAGKGDIVDWLYANGAQCVYACELHPDLRKIVSGKCEMIGTDFFKLTAEDVSHVQLVVMNPPFSLGASHILHAWKIAPEGCEIVALCNWETINKDYYGTNRELAALINSYGEGIDMGNCFTKAERTTDVRVGLVRLFKPKVSAGRDFDGFYLDVEEEVNENGMMPYNEIRAIVNNYVGAVNCFGKVESIAAELRSYTDRSFSADASPFTFGNGLKFQISSYKDNCVVSKAAFAKEMQKQCWQYIFNRVGIQKYVTKGVLEDINKFIESRQNYPFTMKNVYRMLEIIVGTREHTMNRAIVDAIDNFTRYTHENRYGVEGWKTNEGHLLNRKFITSRLVESDWSGGIRPSYRSESFNDINDLEKALCFVSGRNYDEVTTIERHMNAMRPLESNRWYSATFFEYKVFKKGSTHFKFQNEDDWAILNRAYAKIKGQVLPEKMKA